jgi:hypothetical protein
MKDELLNLIPSELLNLIYIRFNPSIKYKLNKENFINFYCYRFALINNKKIHYIKCLNQFDFYNIRNYKYIKYLIKYNNIFCFENIIYNKLKLNATNILTLKEIMLTNKFKNLSINNNSNNNSNIKSIIININNSLIKNYFIKHKILFESKEHYNFIIFCYFFAEKYNSYKIIDLLDFLCILLNYKFVNKKQHKNIDKNINRSKIWRI